MKTIGCVILAAGCAARFRSNKLTAVFRGKPLFQWAMDVLPTGALTQVAVVTRFAPIAAEALAHGFAVVENAQPELGQSYSVALGTTALAHCDGILFLVADQPCLRQETVLHVIETWQAHPTDIVAVSCGERRGNPCLFPRRFFPDLLALTGDKGGGAVIRANPGALRTVPTTAEELTDVDTQEAFYTLEGQREERQA